MKIHNYFQNAPQGRAHRIRKRSNHDANGDGVYEVEIAYVNVTELILGYVSRRVPRVFQKSLALS